MTGAPHRMAALDGGPFPRKQVVVVNQFLPPDPAPTARLAGELMQALPEIDWRPISVRRPYRGVRRGGFVRRLWEEWADLRALGRAMRAGSRPDAILALSSPPLLLEEAARAAQHLGVPLHHWVLDLYPDVAVALGQIPAWVGSWFARRMDRALRSCVTVTAVDEAMADRLSRVYRVRAGVCRPWPEEVEEEAFPGWPGVPEQAPVWLYSGNLGRAHDGEVLLHIQAGLERRNSPWWLVIQGGGPGYTKARALASRLGLRRCSFVPYAPPGQLPGAMARAAVCVATQRTETAGMLWPSKVATLAALARAVLWLGPMPEGATHPLRQREAVGAFDPGEVDAALVWLESIREQVPEPPLANRVGLRQAGVAYWRRVLLS